MVEFDMNNLTNRQKTELAALAALPDERVDTSDIPERADWNDARRAQFYRPLKKPVTIRLDADVLAWFKAHSDKYQTAINQALRDYISSTTK